MIKKLPAILLLLIFTVGCLQERDVRLRSCAAADLLTYVEKPDSSYKWEKVSKTDAVFSSGFLLKMTSQTWQGITWTHDIEIFMPAKSEFPGTAFLMITFGKLGRGESQIGSLLAALNQPAQVGTWHPLCSQVAEQVRARTSSRTQRLMGVIPADWEEERRGYVSGLQIR